MPTNRNALIRYKTIDTCLRNRYRKWTLQDLIEACSEALYEYEGIETGVSRRTVQQDIQTMRSEKLGYNAPIVVVDRKYYMYKDTDYTITQIPLTEHDLDRMGEAVDVLRQFSGFSHFEEFEGMVQRLEDKVHTSRTKQRPIIDMEKNELLKGLNFISPLYQAILKHQCLCITYQSFRAKEASNFDFHPYLLKEHRNRWFVLGKKEGREKLMLLALDRIQHIVMSEVAFEEMDPERLQTYFQSVIGVTVNEGNPVEKVDLFVQPQHVPYVLTKPLHHSQEVVEATPQGMHIQLNVRLNFELEKEILAFGEGIQVIGPALLKRRVKARIQRAFDGYNTELSAGLLKNLPQRLVKRGHAIAEQVMRQRDLNQIGLYISRYQSNHTENPHAIRRLLQRIPELGTHVFTRNILRILHQVDPKLFLVRAIFFDKPPEANWYVTWHQDKTIHVKERKEVEGFSGWTHKDEGWHVVPTDEILHTLLTIRIHLDDTDGENGALRVLPGSHRKRMQDSEIQLLTENVSPSICEVSRGGIHLMRPLLLHASSKSLQKRGHRRVVHLEFSSVETLPGGLEWAEKMTV